MGEDIKSFTFVSEELENGEVTFNVQIPLTEPLDEYVHRLLTNADNIPYYLCSDLLAQLKTFIDAEVTKKEDAICMEKLRAANEDTIEAAAKYWEQLFRNESVAYAEPEPASDQELLALMYHKLVHSPHLEAILQTEQVFADTARAAADKRRETIGKLTDRQNEAMAAAVKELSLDNGTSEREINALAARQLEEHNLTNGRLTSELEALHNQQKAEYTHWLSTIIQQMAIDSTPLPSPAVSPMSHAPGPLPPLDDSNRWPQQEESFTIHLGSQLKQMHNVRILAAHVLDFCTVRSQPGGAVDSRRVQTALGLYSTSLCGLVILSDVGPVGGFSGVLADVTQVCQQTTELHFPPIQDQLQAMKHPIADAVKWRTQNQIKQGKKAVVSKNLQCGDVYITKHSNLAQVHVLFHMITDDSVKSNEINSRHPVILGLRNVLKTAAIYDVTTVTLPLLLSHEMTEEMTVAWCSRRAELVFKCVKGFMMEAAGGGGAHLDNLQFLLPPNISPDVFAALAAMLPTIFRVSNPLVIKSTSSTTTLTPPSPSS